MNQEISNQLLRKYLSTMTSSRVFEKSNICVIGGKGRMGQWFNARFIEAGMDPIVFDLGDFPISETVLQSFDIIFLAVPIGAVEDVMASIGRYLRPDSVVMDITSVKIKPLSSMLKHSRSEVIGSHPLFGPSAKSLVGQTVFLCPVRTNLWVKPVRAFLEARGAKVLEIDGEKHDRLMACFQTLRHLMLTALGRTLIDIDIEPDIAAVFAGPWFGRLLELLRHQSLQPAELYADLAIENEFVPETLEVFRNNFGELAAFVSNRDRSGLLSLIDEVAQTCSNDGKLSEDCFWGWWRDMGGDSRHPDV
ncbi:MAG: prephenate dehydrogenase/arogenate dehydrogenase family protein [Pseudomonadota bacterium]